VSDYLQRLIADCGAVEVRHLPTAQSGLFDDVPALLSSIKRFEQFGGLYCTLNEPTRPATNRFGELALKDRDMVRIKRIPFDFDPVRHGALDQLSSTAQIEAARGACLDLAAKLCSLGFPRPLLAFSGNGYHLQYRTDLPAGPGTVRLLDTIYRGLAEACSSAEVVFDRTVRNPSRILRLYGTVNRKGGGERPTRCWIPDPWLPVGLETLLPLAQRLASRSPTREHPVVSDFIRGAGDYKTLDVAAWMSAHGLYEAAIGDRKHAVRCPWEDEHSASGSKNDTIVLEADGGWPNFYCHHAHCVDRGIREVIDLLGDADRYCATSYR